MIDQGGGKRAAYRKKEIEDYREEKLAEERKRWDEDFGYSEPGTAVIGYWREIKNDDTCARTHARIL